MALKKGTLGQFEFIQWKNGRTSQECLGKAWLGVMTLTPPLLKEQLKGRGRRCKKVIGVLE